MTKKSKYNKEFKQNTIRLSKESNQSQQDFEKEMGIETGSISRWKHELHESGKQTSPEKGTPRDREIAALKQAKEQLRQERDMLKKSLGVLPKSREQV